MGAPWGRNALRGGLFGPQTRFAGSETTGLPRSASLTCGFPADVRRHAVRDAHEARFASAGRKGKRTEPTKASSAERTRPSRNQEDAKRACKPGSVVDDHLSRGRVATDLLSRATRARIGPIHGAPICSCSGWGLPSHPVAEVLVVSYTTVSAFPLTLAGQWESSFLRHFPSNRSARPLAGILPCGARTFLIPKGTRPSGPLRDQAV